MKELASMSTEAFRGIKVVLTDIDDTLTTDGRLTSEAYSALEALKNAKIKVIPVTGRSAGWCDHIARMWPVDAIVGENGAFYFRYDNTTKIMNKRFSQDKTERVQDTKRLLALREKLETEIPGCRAASDQDYRIADLAIDVAEDVTPLPSKDIRSIVAHAEEAGATAKVSSIHVNCWFGNHSKLSSSVQALEECFGIDETNIQQQSLFVGDSPNDAQMFHYFDYSIGVANVLNTLEFLTDKPKYICKNSAGNGFVEVANRLLSAHKITNL
ncbi:MAG: HAD-IIB family hydrolase [Gammaproteobacteria bacterium]|nr:HAD-IIB family hydrolase [Gammaproteobacteria bacterium]